MTKVGVNSGPKSLFGTKTFQETYAAAKETHALIYDRREKAAIQCAIEAANKQNTTTPQRVILVYGAGHMGRFQVHCDAHNIPLVTIDATADAGLNLFATRSAHVPQTNSLARLANTRPLPGLKVDLDKMFDGSVGAARNPNSKDKQRIFHILICMPCVLKGSTLY